MPQLKDAVLSRHLTCSFLGCLLMSILLLVGCSGDSSDPVSANEGPSNPEPASYVRPQLILGTDGEIVCERDFGDPNLSPYVLPYSVGKSNLCRQSYCSAQGDHQSCFAFDFSTTIGDTVVAARAGVVIRAVDSFVDGQDMGVGQNNFLFIIHADSTVALYAHLKQNSIMPKEGDAVSRGVPIALSGNTGTTGGVPHLHFQLFRDSTSWARQNSIPINFLNTSQYLDDNNALMEGVNYKAKPIPAN